MTQRAITVLLKAITGPYEASMGRAAGTTQAFGTSTRGAQAGAGSLKTSLGGLTAALGGGAGLMYGLRASVDMLAEYETALVGVGKTTGLTGDELSQMGTELSDLSVGIAGSAEDMLGIAQSAAQLGVANEDIVGFTEVIANMASATDLTVDTAATQMARLANIVGLPQDEFENLGSSIVEMGNTMATTEPEILDMAQRVASAGRAAGLTTPEIIGLSAAASQLGLRAEAGGSALSQTLVKIQEAAVAGGDALDGFAQVSGMSAEQFATQWREAPVETLTAFLEGLDGIQTSGGNVAGVLDELGLDGLRVSDALRRLSGDTEGVVDATTRSTQAFEENAALADEAAVANATLANAMEGLQDELKNTYREMIGSGDSAQALALGFRAATAAVDPFIEAWSRIQFLTPRAVADGVGWLLDLGRAVGIVAPGAEELERQARSNAASTDRWAAAAERAYPNVSAVGDAAGGAAGPMGDLGGATDDAATAAERLREQNELLADQLRAQTDPVFAVKQALDAVVEAEDAYSAAVDEHGENSDEAAAATWELFDAITEATGAALESEEGFDFARERIQQMGAAGLISESQVGMLLDILSEVAGAANSLAGDYRMDLYLQMNPEDYTLLRRIENLRNSSGSTPVPVEGPQAVVPVRARAGGGRTYPGETYMVGEEGPELFQGVGRITPATQTRALLGSSDSGTTDNRTFNAYLTGDDKQDALMALRKMSLRYT